MATGFTVVDDGTVRAVSATCTGGRAAISPADVQRALGWELKPEGLCRAAVCIPVGDRAALVGDDGIDLDTLASVLGRPLALDADEHVAYLGIGAATRAQALASLEAPDFTLPDFEGTMHSLSDYRGRKVLLVAYASW